MNKSLLTLVLLTVSLTSCVNSSLRNDVQKVIVVHARGISYPEMQEYLTTTSSDLFFKAKQKEGLINRITPITNAVTITNIASYETGNLPNGHGIIGHLYAKKDGETLKLANGFTQAFETPTFWEKADLSEKKVLNVGTLTLHGKYRTHKNVDALSQGRQIGKPQLTRIFPDDTVKSELVTAYKASSQDSITKGYKLYKTNASSHLFLDDDYDPENGLIKKIAIGKWFQHDNLHAKLFRSSEDALRLYIRPSYVNNGYPDEFVNNISDNIAPPKGWPNIAFHTSGLIDQETLLEEIYNEIYHLMDVFSFSSTRKDYDLMMLDYPLMDRIGHAFLALKQNSKEIKDIYKKAFKQMDQDLHTIEAYAKRYGYKLIVTSSHGFSPIHTSVDINKFLTASGVQTDTSNNNWEAIGIPGKVSAHVYLNKDLENTKKQEALEKIKKAFSELKYVSDLVVDKTYSKADLPDIGLDHANAGDVFVMLNPGFVFENNTNKTDFFGTPKFRGDHGYSLSHEDSYAVLISDMVCKSCNATDVARMIEKILKI